MFCVVAVDEASGGQAAVLGRHQDSIHRSEEAGIVGRDEEHERSNENRRIKEVAALVALDEAAEIVAIACSLSAGE